MCDTQDRNSSCVFHGNLKGVIEEDSPICSGEVSVFSFHICRSDLPLYFACNLLNPIITKSVSIMSGVISSAAARVRGNQDHLFVSASDFVIEN